MESANLEIRVCSDSLLILQLTKRPKMEYHLTKNRLYVMKLSGPRIIKNTVL